MTVRLSECPICLLDGPDNEPCPCQMTHEQREIRGLRKRLADAEQRAEMWAQRAQCALIDETSARVEAGLARGRQLLERARAERAERELERWRLRLRDRARRRKEETEGDHGIDWLAKRERIHAYREKLDAELRREGRAWALESQAPAMPRAIMAHLRERVRLPEDP